jgi:hypothetical protein
MLKRIAFIASFTTLFAFFAVPAAYAADWSIGIGSELQPWRCPLHLRQRRPDMFGNRRTSTAIVGCLAAGCRVPTTSPTPAAITQTRITTEVSHGAAMGIAIVGASTNGESMSGVNTNGASTGNMSGESTPKTGSR